MNPHDIVKIELIPIELPLIEPFIISYGTAAGVESVLVRITDRAGNSGWGEGTPDETVTGENPATLLRDLTETAAPGMLGFDTRRRDLATAELERLLPNSPTARCAIDIALHDLAGRNAGLPLWALLGGSTSTVQISRVVSMREPERMAADARKHVAGGFTTVKLKVGQKDAVATDIERVRQVRAAVGSKTGIKIDVNQGWVDADTAVEAMTAMREFAPDYIEQPVSQHDLNALAEARKRSGVRTMVDEACHGPADMLRVVALEAADLVNIKLMKTGGLHSALAVDAIARAAGIGSQIGTMVESSIASAAGLHFAASRGNVQTVEMGGPIMLAEDIGNARSWYDAHTITVPDEPGLGIDVDSSAVRRYALQWIEICA
ncbi:MAG TPA: dipeptide epimerase [Thermomicrobiales bacterium]|nr:dipeptide epimerase [Thermomicrobiales bacterium]